MLGILPEDFEAMPRATDYIESMKSLITRIHSNGFAYIDEGSVYFDLARWRDEHPYGVLFNVDPTAIVKGARISADEYSREEVSDFVLWKAAKPNEPFWEFELGGHRLPGRPGWHIECSAMGHDLLGLPFDIHTGGVDLRFPHHEDEIAQSAAGYGDQTAAFWVHNEFLEVEGAKMSKSAGNFYTLQDLIAKKLDPLDIRFAFLSVHYASVFNFTFTGLEASRKARMRVQDYIYKLHEKSSGTTAFDVASLRREVFEHLADNLHSPKALERLFSHINGEQPDSVDARSKEALLDFFTEINNIFGVWTIAERPVIQIPVEVVNLAKKRLQAKRDRDFPGADALRNEILSHGFQVRDTKDGFELTPVEG